MAHERDYENIHDVEELDDTELRELVREQLAAHTALDIDDITVSVVGGTVTLAGRVGTEGERRVAEHVLTDVLGISEFSNDLVIDSLRRGESPVEIDEHLADEGHRAGTLLGDVEVSMTDESSHLADHTDDELDGTTNYQQVMDEGLSWNPPDSPTPEGMAGSDARPEDMGGQH